MHLRASDISIDRGGRRIVSALSFEVAAGEALVLTGPNGAGKTTLIRAIAGFLPVAEGTIALDGDVPVREIAEQCHLVGHRDGIKSELTVAENARFFGQYFGTPSTPRAGKAARTGEGGAIVHDRRAHVPPSLEGALDRLGLAALADVPAAYLSAGQRRRLGLSRLLLARRPIWLLDEPTVSLDSAAVATLAAMIGEHLAGGGIAVAATHIPLGLEDARELRLGQGPATAA